jgi:hypothetical protein
VGVRGGLWDREGRTVAMCVPSIVCCGFYWGGLQHAARRAGERRGKAEKRTGRDEGEKAGKGTDSKGYAGEKRQRLCDPNPGCAGYSASIHIFSISHGYRNNESTLLHYLTSFLAYSKIQVCPLLHRLMQSSLIATSEMEHDSLSSMLGVTPQSVTMA